MRLAYSDGKHTAESLVAIYEEMEDGSIMPISGSDIDQVPGVEVTNNDLDEMLSLLKQAKGRPKRIGWRSEERVKTDTEFWAEVANYLRTLYQSANEAGNTIRRESSQESSDTEGKLFDLNKSLNEIIARLLEQAVLEYEMNDGISEIEAKSRTMINNFYFGQWQIKGDQAAVVYCLSTGEFMTIRCSDYPSFGNISIDIGDIDFYAIIEPDTMLVGRDIQKAPLEEDRELIRHGFLDLIETDRFFREIQGITNNLLSGIDDNGIVSATYNIDNGQKGSIAVSAKQNEWGKGYSEISIERFFPPTLDGPTSITYYFYPRFNVTAVRTKNASLDSHEKVDSDSSWGRLDSMTADQKIELIKNPLERQLYLFGEEDRKELMVLLNSSLSPVEAPEVFSVS